MIAVLPAAQVHANLVGVMANVGRIHNKACMIGMILCAFVLLMPHFCSGELEMLGIQQGK